MLRRELFFVIKWFDAAQKPYGLRLVEVVDNSHPEHLSAIFLDRSTSRIFDRFFGGLAEILRFLFRHEVFLRKGIPLGKDASPNGMPSAEG